jgi:hypothetical protein
MLRRSVTAALTAGVLLTLAPAAQAKISVPLTGRILQAGQQIELRVPGCKSSRVCRWAAGVRLVLALPYDRNHPQASMRTVAPLGTVSAYGMLRFRVPQVTTGTYTAVAIWPHGSWPRSMASGPFAIQS